MSLTPREHARRSIQRHLLNDYLKVYNRNTMREMGNVGNISCNGLMLVSNVPVLIGAVYNMRIVVPSDNGESSFLDFDARCHWCKPDVGPEFFDSGYSIISAGNDMIDLVDSLKKYFSFSEK